MELNRFKQLLESQIGNVKPLLYEQGEEVIITNHDSDYDYKKVGDKFYFKLKENPKSSRAKSFKTQGKYIDWTESTGAGLESIKKSVYKMTPAGSGGVGSSTETPKSKGVEKADTPKEPEYGCAEGDCVNGKGKFIFSISEIKKPFYYEGSFKDSFPTGGKYTFPDGSYQIGMFTTKGMVGKEFYPNGNLKFVGNFESRRTPVVGYIYAPIQGEKYYPNGKLEFRGRYKKKGYKQNDLLTITTDLFLYFVEMDQGTYFYNDGSYYQGHYKNNLPNGQGIKYGANDKIIFSGEWVNGEPKERGINFGCVLGDCENGKGKYVFDDVEYYYGDFKDYKRNGKGRYVYGDDNSYYYGDWKDGNKNGKGTIFNSRGQVLYNGDWKDGERNGKGTSYYYNGKVEYSGEWVNGEPKKK